MLQWIWGKPKENRYELEECVQPKMGGCCCCTCRYQMRTRPFPRHDGKPGWCCVLDMDEGIIRLKDNRHGMCSYYQKRRKGEKQVSLHENAIRF